MKPNELQHLLKDAKMIRVPISAELSILSKRARSTFRILPLNGRIA